jgi:hypothetical protein
MQIDGIFEVLNKKYSRYKFDRLLKNENRKSFIEKLKQAKNSIHLLGLNYPNFFTTSEDKILEAFRYLDDNKVNINVYIFIPSKIIMETVDALNIYHPDRSPSKVKINIDKIRALADSYLYLKFHIYEYSKLHMLGASAIDLGTPDAFTHLSKVESGRFIDEAEFFNFDYSNETKEVFALVESVFGKIMSESNLLI